MQYKTIDIQRALNRHEPSFAIAEDGIMGPETEAAISVFKGKRGLQRRPLIGPITLSLLFPGEADPDDPKISLTDGVPWVNELARHMHWHEERDNAKLREWLKSDGATLGDPAVYPWCGDAMQTAIRLTLPDEPFPGDLGRNPYWARNWALFGEESPLAYGAMITLVRGKGGHIGTAVGFDKKAKRIRLRGGNQSNSINDTWIDGRSVSSGGRVLAIRKPKTYTKPLPPIPLMNSHGEVISTNEA